MRFVHNETCAYQAQLPVPKCQTYSAEEGAGDLDTYSAAISVT